ncbi:hypothetical protein SODALDRAFT_318674 [Sodiomyces alkalinus F11]|uniref:HNH nuclease domain-containing protein n=1 Tax=Sodiomyces alkalinus (strain CBS 110278 / VKM F-3762 / F11) TaxID=1314773 RepID=A0A3N2Q5G0_SODAK|nr:hypothetical protein SODALDRAFT_318674 [Sodiomyces alkalinus F11]ROT41865.1 hypothetical protein SODALDRAFT_318674 [Sodiomyces alkalinus F11]
MSAVPENIRIQGDAPAWHDRLQKFREMCTEQVGGFRRQDLAYVALSVCAPRQRIPQSAKGFDYMNTETDLEKSVRQRVIHKLYDRLLKEYSQKNTVSDEQFSYITSALSWALLQITNIKEMLKLERTLDSAETVPEYFEDIKAIVEAWDLHFKIFFTQPLSGDQKRLGEGGPPVSKTPRSRKVKELCIARDRVCVLTGAREPHVAHIYPFGAASARQTKSALKDTLARLWGADRETAISETLFPDGTTKGIDVIGNVICLSPNMHAAWSRYDFALFPLRSTDEKEEGPWSIQVVFHWLKRRQVQKMSEMAGDMRTSAREVLLRTSRGVMEREPRDIDLRTNAPILDGQIFTINANKKDHLPDYDILMLQWDIARMASLCGAAEPEDDSDSDSPYYYDEEEVMSGVEAEVEVTSEETTDVQQ